jgi:hypothetical protein
MFLFCLSNDHRRDVRGHVLLPLLLLLLLLVVLLPRAGFGLPPGWREVDASSVRERTNKELV